MRITLRIQERAGAEREMTLESAVEVGRDVETPDIRIEDPTISRRHARLQPTDHGVQVTDLGSSNGTSVSGGPVLPGVPVLAADGAMIAMGDTTIHVSCRETDPARSDQTTSATAPLQSPATLEPAPPESAPDRSPVARRRVSLDDLEVLENDAIVIRSMPGTLGSKAAPKVADTAAQARRKLAGLGSEPWGAKPTICLVDPYPAPDNPTIVVTEGTTVDAVHDEIRMVVTAEAPAEQTGEAVPAGPDAFDPISVLAQLPPFAGLDKAALADVAGRLSAGSMEPGSVMTEGEGQLVLVVSGRAQVWQPGLGGPAVSAEFGAGDVFGLSALLGNTRDSELRAVDQCGIAVLDAATIRTLAERYPAVAAGLARGGSRVAPATGGRQLTRATFAGLPQMTPDRPEGQIPAVDHRRIQQEVRRASGVYDRILP